MKAILYKEITMEYQGSYSTIEIGSIVDWLVNIKEISNDLNDFLIKVTNGLTDETSKLSAKDNGILAEFYFTEL